MKLYRSKLDWIGPWVEDKNVLDLGCVCHDLSQMAVPWLHGFIKQRAKRVVGVDILPEAIEQLKADGYDVQQGNVETMALGEKFDVIVAGDIIEHLNDFDAFFNRVKEHLNADGVFLVTTPNPVNYLRLMRILIKGSAGGNKQHTCWFTPKVLVQLAQRFGFELADEAWVDDSRYFYPWLKATKKRGVRKILRNFSRLLSMLLIWKPACWATSLLARIRPRFSETFCLALKLQK